MYETFRLLSSDLDLQLEYMGKSKTAIKIFSAHRPGVSLTYVQSACMEMNAVRVFLVLCHKFIQSKFFNWWVLYSK